MEAGLIFWNMFWITQRILCHVGLQKIYREVWFKSSGWFYNLGISLKNINSIRHRNEFGEYKFASIENVLFKLKIRKLPSTCPRDTLQTASVRWAELVLEEVLQAFYNLRFCYWFPKI